MLVFREMEFNKDGFIEYNEKEIEISEYQNVLKYLYHELEPEDAKFIENEIKTRPHIAMTYYGHKQLKREKGFATIEQHNEWIDQGKAALKRRFMEILNKKKK